MTDDDDELTPPFDHRVPNDTTPWVEVTSIQDDLRPGGGRDLPFRLFATRFKSSSEDSEYFLHDPLRHMLAKPGALKGLPGWPDASQIDDDDERALAVGEIVDGLRDDPRWHVTTFVANHHRKLSRIHSSVVAIIGPDGIHLMLYKDADQGSIDFS